jgi:hypothetical protein
VNKKSQGLPTEQKNCTFTSAERLPDKCKKLDETEYRYRRWQERKQQSMIYVITFFI